MMCANTKCWAPKSEAARKQYQQQVQEKITTNVVKISFEGLKQLSKTYTNTSPIFCRNCQAVLNYLSKIEDKKWKCEFCTYENELEKIEQVPTSSDIFYMLENPNEQKKMEEEQRNDDNSNQIKNDGVDLEDKRTIIFCLDNSGSMSSGSVIVDSKGEKKYVSRKKCVENSIETQINQMKKSHPNRKVGIVLFSSQLTVIGDGCSAPKQVFEPQGSFEKFFELGQSCFKIFMNHKIGENDSLISGYKETRTNGLTALGPALAFSLGLASQSNPESGASIIVCTDGMANVGLGNLEGENQDENSYRKMGLLSKSEGIQINVMTMKGIESGVKILGELAMETGGKTSRLSAGDFHFGFSEFLKSDVVATKVEIVMQLHEGLKLIEGNPHEAVGTASENSSLSFQYALKDQYDFGNIKEVPLQAKVFFCGLDGSKMVRVITKSKQLTSEQEKSLENVQIGILAGHANKNNARMAQKVSLEEAQVQSDKWNHYIQKEVYSHNREQVSEIKKFEEKRSKLDKAICTKQKRKANFKEVAVEEEEDAEQDLFELQ